MSSKKKPVGRPSGYDPEIHPGQANKLCLLGATDAEMAAFFGISESTLNLWKTKHPEFSEALKDGKQAADSDVARRLYERAMGYSHKAVKIFMPAGAAEPVYADYTEHYPPDATSMIFWLKNRQPGRWRDKVEHSGPDGGPIKLMVLESGFGDETEK
jgi:hypothetical protein